MTAPNNQAPEGAYVSGGSGQSSITDLNGLDEAGAKARMRAPLQGTFAGMSGGFWGVINGILGVLGGAVSLVVGAVQIVVDGIKGVVDAIGSLFGAAHQDTSAVDAARVAGENAIVANMGKALDQLDEIQRGGGAYMRYPYFDILNGETVIYPLPLTDPMPLSTGVGSINSGTGWIPPVLNTNIASGTRFTDSTSLRESHARRSGQLELLESGLWLIFFQASVLQGNQYTSRPADLFCHVSDAGSPWLPIGPPGLLANGDAIPGMQMARHRGTGVYDTVPESGFLQAYGRAGSYIGIRDTGIGGGNSMFGMVPALLPSPGWKVSLSVSTFARYGGPSTTYVFAYKVNSESLRDDIDAMKIQLAQDLPGQSVDMLLDEASIAAMVAGAQALEVGEVEVPTEYPEGGNG